MITSDEKHHELKVRPDWRFLLSHPAHLLAFGFGSGLARFAPGTFGTLVAYPIYWYLAPRLSDNKFMLFLVLAFFTGVWACGHTGKKLGVIDYGGIVWDEIVAMWLLLAFTPVTWIGWLAAFGLFRFFDILKPWPIRWFDVRLKNGFGVMFDDLLAAFYALLVIKGWQWLA